MLERLVTASSPFDVLVVGGGITGCGVALDAATRGLSVALVERDDFASGTSSKSSKLIHGGLRYLQSGDVRLVYEALRERQRLMRNAPHLLSIQPFLIPVLTRDGAVSKKVAKALRAAMWLYDLTGGLRIGRRHRRLDAAATLAHCPTLVADRVSSGFLYYDAAADDARVTLTVAMTAAGAGAVVANRCEVVDIVADDTGRVAGAVVDTGAGRIEVPARTVVSATGVWADDVRALDSGSDADSLRPAKGVHITVPWDAVRNDVAVVLSVPNDKRSLFMIPWIRSGSDRYAHCYIGTTDTDFTGSLDDPQTNEDDLDYVLGALNHHLTTPLTCDDVTGVWAGLRPLVRQASSGRTADLSRRHQVTVSESGLVTVTGGKFTTYRQMAEDAVDAVVAQLGTAGARSRRCRTRRLRLVGADRSRRSERGGDRLHGRYGSLAPAVEQLVAQRPELAGPLVPGLEYTRAEAVHAVRHEMATTLDDVLLRRTRAHLQHRDACLAAAPAVARLLADELGWDTAETERQLAEYRLICAREEAAAGRLDPRHAALVREEPGS